MNLNENPTPIPDVKPFLDTLLTNERDDSTVTTVPLRCGSGKSTYIHEHIREGCTSDSTDGAIIVTDSVKRLCEYDHPEDDPLDSLLREYPNDICIITADNAQTEIRRQATCKFLLMTTQRYFRFTREELKNLLRYNKGKRTTIIFDERPSFKETRTLTEKDFNDVDSALKLGLDDTVDQVEKAWCISQWGRLRDMITSKMDSYEKNIPKAKFSLWHKNDERGMTVDDSRFMRFIEDCRAKISTQKFVDAYRIILAVKQLSEDGAVFSCAKTKSGEYRKWFSLAIDNREKLIGLGAKVFVLDATADIDPIYQADYVRIVNCEKFNIPLPNLHIRIADINTSKNRICAGNDKAKRTLDAIKKDISEKTPNTPIFTFKQIEKEFPAHPTKHFGNIKGFNDARTCDSIVQVGVNRYREVEYFLMGDFSPDKMGYLKSLSPEKSVEEFDKIFKFHEKAVVSIRDTMTNAILTDIEQNLFRGAIRNMEYTGNYLYTMYFKARTYADLIEKMTERYARRLHAVIDEPEKVPEEHPERNPKEPTATGIGDEWLDKQPSGRIFKRQDVCDETGMLHHDFKNWKRLRRNIFCEMKTEKQGVYRKP